MNPKKPARKNHLLASDLAHLRGMDQLPQILCQDLALIRLSLLLSTELLRFLALASGLSCQNHHRPPDLVVMSFQQKYRKGLSFLSMAGRRIGSWITSQYDLIRDQENTILTMDWLQEDLPTTRSALQEEAMMILNLELYQLLGHTLLHRLKKAGPGHLLAEKTGS